MDRKTLLAVVISVVILVLGYVVIPALFPTKPAPLPAASAPQDQSPQAAQSGTEAPAAAASSGQTATAQAASQKPVAGTTLAVPGKVVPLPDSAPPASQGDTIVRETDLYTLTFAAQGATLTSVKLKKYKNLDGSPVEMLLLPPAGTTGEMPFALSFGDYTSEQLTVPFALKESGGTNQSTYDFSRTFLSPTGVPFTLHKSYVFDKDEYLFELRVTIQNSVNDFPSLNFGGFAYTLTMGPQIGPHYIKLDGRNDYRNYAYWAENKRQDPGVKMGSSKELEKDFTWTAVVGKYFTAIAQPVGTAYHVVFDSRQLVPGFDRSTISFERPPLQSPTSTDTFRFYLGPMKTEILSLYNDKSTNQFGISGLNADKVVTSSILIGWLATLLKYVLDFFYLLIPNYGIAIILLTLVTKLVFLPLTFSGSESMAKMAALNPKMAEIRARLKDKPDKMNQEIAALYKREKVNPLSGCLPLLLQMPVFFALYNLLNSHFELRGAMFIPGWIPDLSVPESIVNFGFTIPLVGWTALRALPLLMVASQLLSSKFTQPSSAPQQGGGQAKLMMYALPIVFLFILYDMPSGLVLYWTVQNILSTVQQVYINNLRKKKDAQSGQTPVYAKSSAKPGAKALQKSGK
ncbi:MAG: membrane protein insertase YidC [Spirochaetia bacterium]|jgi:YidC/Oxa1 family membrane protein insertase